MATISNSISVKFANVFAPKEEGWGETVAVNFDKPIKGYKVGDEGKVEADVNQVSFFVSQLTKVMCADATVGAFWSSKTHDEKLVLLPVLLSGATLTVESEHNEEDKEYIRTITKVVLAPAMVERCSKALDKLFGF